MAITETLHVCSYNGVWHIADDRAQPKTKCGIPYFNVRELYVPLQYTNRIVDLEDYIGKYEKSPKLCRNCFSPYFGTNYKVG